ncbi:LOW QUALITY PROTEIN: hypothetical protein PHMEG_00025394 [Phytophthora megakarya]|uniref:Reverse transcriptase n=1 Tax=Phytophthora megakarya TaxID=4795 RepID=A0A225VC52_9STRA|nr:LOW QUALITY PROTEIN: hypothetical protein PHMEG_00025394 [Phytophthora megakarya]
MIRHDQDPRFMSEVFTRFRELLADNVLHSDIVHKRMDNRKDPYKQSFGAFGHMSLRWINPTGMTTLSD